MGLDLPVFLWGPVVYFCLIWMWLIICYSVQCFLLLTSSYHSERSTMLIDLNSWLKVPFCRAIFSKSFLAESEVYLWALCLWVSAHYSKLTLGEWKRNKPAGTRLLSPAPWQNVRVLLWDPDDHSENSSSIGAYFMENIPEVFAWINEIEQL